MMRDKDSVTDGRVVLDFDHHSLEASHNRPAFIERAQQHPIFWTEAHGGFWVVTTNALVREVHSDPVGFSSDKNPEGKGGITIPEIGPRMIPVETDPPYHTRLREILNPLFNWRAVQTLRPLAERVMDEALDRIVEAGAFDAAELCMHLPSEVVASYLGFPDDTRPVFVESVDHILSLQASIGARPDETPDPDQFQRGIDAYTTLQSVIADLLAQRRAAPQDDLATVLTQVDDPPLDAEELFYLYLVLYMGGTHNISATMSNILVYLADDPALRQRLVDEPALYPAAHKEFLRYVSVSPGVARTVTRDMVLGGQQLRAGDRLLGSMPAANYDPTVFENPHEVILHRKEIGESLAFGHGTHTCLGIGLTRMEMEVLLSKVLARMPNYTIDLANARRVDDAHTAYSWETIPARP